MLHLKQYAIGDIDLAQIKCTDLVDLDIYMEETGKGSGGGGGEGEGMMPLQPVKRLLRSNHHIRTLTWRGIGNPAPLLDADDFASPVGLKSLIMNNWDGSNGRLGMVLGKVAGSLKELLMEWMCNVEPVFLNCEEFMLSRLESLVWSVCKRDAGNGDKSMP